MQGLPNKAIEHHDFKRVATASEHAVSAFSVTTKRQIPHQSGLTSQQRHGIIVHSELTRINRHAEQPILSLQEFEAQSIRIIQLLKQTSLTEITSTAVLLACCRCS